MPYSLIRAELIGDSEVYLCSLVSSGERNVLGFVPDFLLDASFEPPQTRSKRVLHVQSFVSRKLFPQSKYALKHSTRRGTVTAALNAQTESCTVF